MRMILPLLTTVVLLLEIPFSAPFSLPPPTFQTTNSPQPATPASSLGSTSSSSSTTEPPSSNPTTDEPPSVCDPQWSQYASINSITTPKLSIHTPHTSQRGKGGVHATSPIAALEVIARIPRRLLLAASDLPSSTKGMEAASNARVFSWAVDLTAVVLVALHHHPATTDGSNNGSTKEWISGWKEGGWATSGSDLGPPEAKFGSSSCTGSLLSTGSDNDHNVFAKFRLPAHPVVHRASIGLALLTGATETECLTALVARGRCYRGLRDALLGLVEEPPVWDEVGRKGSVREMRAWDVADCMSRVLSRVSMVNLDGGGECTAAVVPLYERLAQNVDGRGANVKLVYSSSNAVQDGDTDTDTDDEEEEGSVWMVATRDIAVGEAITREYADAPRLEEDTSDGALRLLLQFGLPPDSWTTSSVVE